MRYLEFFWFDKKFYVDNPLSNVVYLDEEGQAIKTRLLAVDILCYLIRALDLYFKKNATHVTFTAR